jgi:hypothetical protein
LEQLGQAQARLAGLLSGAKIPSGKSVPMVLRRRSYLRQQVATTEKEHSMTTTRIGKPALSTIAIGNFDFWGLTFWRWCGVVYGALFAAAAICVLVLDTSGVSDTPNIVWQLIVSFALLNWASRMKTEARRVQSGWIGRTTALWSTKKSRSGTHEQFAKTCGRGLSVMGRMSALAGALLILLWSLIWFLDVYASALHNELRAEIFTGPMHVFVGLAYLAFGAVAIDSRHILSSPRPAVAPSARGPIA